MSGSGGEQWCIKNAQPLPIHDGELAIFSKRMSAMHPRSHPTCSNCKHPQITDRVFADFSKRVGVASVREYEESALAQARARAEKMADLETQVGACVLTVGVLTGAQSGGAWAEYQSGGA